MTITERYASETARDYALRMLKRSIVSLELKPGMMLSENELSVALGLSRTPIREALIELGKTRIVEVLPQRGSRISLIDCDLVEEARFLRTVLEKAIIEQACELSPTLDFSVAQANVKLQKFYLENHLLDKLLELDNDFHREFFRLTNRLQTQQLLAGMTLHFDRLRSLSLIDIDASGIVKDHGLLLEAVQKGDKTEALAILTIHLNRSKLDEKTLRVRHPAYFKPETETCA